MRELHLYLFDSQVVQLREFRETPSLTDVFQPRCDGYILEWAMALEVGVDLFGQTPP